MQECDLKKAISFTKHYNLKENELRIYMDEIEYKIIHQKISTT